MEKITNRDFFYYFFVLDWSANGLKFCYIWYANVVIAIYEFN